MCIRDSIFLVGGAFYLFLCGVQLLAQIIGGAGGAADIAFELSLIHI